MNARLLMFVISNVSITLGYVFLATYVVPRVTVHLWRTKVGGIGFFLLCGLHHLDNVYHVLFQPNEQVRTVMLQAHMLIVDIPQAICVWLFVTGLYTEVVRWGPWATVPPVPSIRRRDPAANDR